MNSNTSTGMNELTPMNIYNSHQYEPLTPQTLPFDTYSPQTLSNGKNIAQINPSSALNTSQSTVTYSSSSNNKTSSTLVNLLHQKRPALIDPPVSQEKPKTSGKQTRKTAQKKTIKQVVTTNDNNNNIQLPNSTQTIMNYPLTRKAKAQQHSMVRSDSEDVSLNMSQSFATPTGLLPPKHSLSAPDHLSFLNTDMVINLSRDFSIISFFRVVFLNSWLILLQDQHQVQNRMLRQNVVEILK
jgi:hypothetical protein